MYVGSRAPRRVGSVRQTLACAITCVAPVHPVHPVHGNGISCRALCCPHPPPGSPPDPGLHYRIVKRAHGPARRYEAVLDTPRPRPTAILTATSRRHGRRRHVSHHRSARQRHPHPGPLLQAPHPPPRRHHPASPCCHGLLVHAVEVPAARSLRVRRRHLPVMRPGTGCRQTQPIAR